jgi:kinesin family protein C2/C3
LGSVAQIHRSLKSESASLASFIPVLVESTKNGVHEALAVQNGLLEESRANFQREAVERKRLHNMVQELKGNIRVFCRVKPLSEEEIGEGIRSCVKVRVAYYFTGTCSRIRRRTSDSAHARRPPYTKFELNRKRC